MPHIISISHDEEITSLVSRLRKDSADEVVLVVPQRAVLLESLINLRLLKREMDEAGKRLVVVTQDERGGACAERAGISVKPHSYVESFRHRARPREVSNTPANIKNPSFSDGPAPAGVGKLQERQESSQETSHVHLENRSVGSRTIPVRRSMDASAASPGRPSSGDIRPAKESTPQPPRQPLSGVIDRKEYFVAQSRRKAEEPSPGPAADPGYVYERVSRRQRDVREEKEPEQHEEAPRGNSDPTAALVSDPREWHRRHENSETEGSKGGRSRGWMFVALTVFLVGALGVGGYFGWKYLPQADLTVYAARISGSGDVAMEIAAGGGDVEARVFEETVAIQESFDATGAQNAETRRATGTVIIYNDYSEEDQPLVATTRLLTEDEKLYRITESVVVPGKEGSTPGEVEVSVKADEAGEEFNIEPSRFTIPGFRGSPKYDGFYAESQEAFLGGGAGESETNIVSESDISRARETMEKRVRALAMERIAEKLEDGWMLSEEAVEVTIEEADAFPAEGTVAEKFEYSIAATARAIAADQADIEAYARQELFDDARRGVSGAEDIAWEPESITIEYGKMTPDFETETLAVKLFADATWRAIVDAEAIKEASLGKDAEELRAMLDEYAGRVEQLDMEVRPSQIFSSVPSVPSRVEVRVE